MLASVALGSNMFRVKICGVTRPEDAQVAVDAGADAVGFNFYAKSKRYCSPDDARPIAEGLAPGVCKVGVFVNATADEIRRTWETVPLDLIQLHGDEPPDLLRTVRPLPIMKAVGFGDNLLPIVAFLESCHKHSAMPRLLLFDAMREGQFGGTGQTVDWEFLARHRPQLRGIPLVLAGGLTAENVAGAITTVRPWAVDVASGVESKPGQKSPGACAPLCRRPRKPLPNSSRHTCWYRTALGGNRDPPVRIACDRNGRASRSLAGSSST